MRDSNRPGPTDQKEGDQMPEKPERDLEKEREELLRLLDDNTVKEVKEAIQIALSALPKPTPPTISYSTKGAADANTQRDC